MVTGEGVDALRIEGAGFGLCCWTFCTKGAVSIDGIVPILAMLVVAVKRLFPFTKIGVFWIAVVKVTGEADAMIGAGTDVTVIAEVPIEPVDTVEDAGTPWLL